MVFEFISFLIKFYGSLQFLKGLEPNLIFRFTEAFRFNFNVKLQLITIFRHELKATAVRPGSAKANGREPKSCLGRVFNFKLGPFVMYVIAWHIQKHALA